MSIVVGAIGAGLGFVVGIFLIGWAIFTFGLFPNLITFLQYVRWINLTSGATNALYWTIVFTWLLGCFRGANIKTKS
jgi:hypothetical protein